jgi:hypothetical protein
METLVVTEVALEKSNVIEAGAETFVTDTNTVAGA